MNAFTSLRLRYMDFPGRAQAIRDTLQIGRIDFVDEHLTYDQFSDCRAAGEFPFGGIPVLVIGTGDGEHCVAQSNAILRFAGRLTGLYPVDDPLQALKVDEVLGVGEDINCLLGPSLHEEDAGRKMAMRKALAEETLPYWMACLDRLLVMNGNSGFIVGNSLTIARVTRNLSMSISQRNCPPRPTAPSTARRSRKSMAAISLRRTKTAWPEGLFVMYNSG